MRGYLDQLAAGFAQLAFKPAAPACHKRPPPRMGDGARNIDRGAFRAARIQFGYDLQDGEPGSWNVAQGIGRFIHLFFVPQPGPAANDRPRTARETRA